VRVGKFGGHAVVETNSRPTATACRRFAAFQFHVELLMAVTQAISTEAAAIAGRDDVR